ncbi:MAG: anti-sigma factor [Candidatus Saccharicenans sp.]|nr:anti-sigma factor [Candidatus Saccharicenans sp.]
MNCRRNRRLINDYLDGELREKDRQQLQSHLEKCASCRQLYEELAAIKKTFLSAGEVNPSDRVWERLKSRLEADIIPQLVQQQTGADKEVSKKTGDWSGWFSPVFRYAAAALVFVVIVAGAFYLGRNYQKPDRPQAELIADNPALQKVLEAEYFYKKAVESLTEALETYNGGLPAELTEIVQANLSLLDRTMDLTRQAVLERPDDPQAREFLMSAYDSKMNFLNSLLETRKSFAGSAQDKL